MGGRRNWREGEESSSHTAIWTGLGGRRNVAACDCGAAEAADDDAAAGAGENGERKDAHDAAGDESGFAGIVAGEQWWDGEESPSRGLDIARRTSCRFADEFRHLQWLATWRDLHELMYLYFRLYSFCFRKCGCSCLLGMYGARGRPCLAIRSACVFLLSYKLLVGVGARYEV